MKIIRSESFKQHLRELHASRKIGHKFEKGNKIWLGKKHSMETRAKMSAACMGEKHHQWKGGTKKLNGYMMVRAPKGHPYAHKTGHILEHRLVIESKIGRFLEPHEIVHHVNRNRLDNRPENLELLVRDHDNPGCRRPFKCPHCGKDF